MSTVFESGSKPLNTCSDFSFDEETSSHLVIELFTKIQYFKSSKDTHNIFKSLYRAYQHIPQTIYFAFIAL